MFLGDTVLLDAAPNLTFLGRHEDRIRRILIWGQRQPFRGLLVRRRAPEPDTSRAQPNRFLHDSEAARAFWRARLSRPRDHAHATTADPGTSLEPRPQIPR